ncbi:hypothetical protein BGZ47_011062, partial [Haplosporangium gracile]
MRAGVQNPLGSNYEVAGPTIGGTASPYNPERIEVAKDHLAESLGKASLYDSAPTTTTTIITSTDTTHDNNEPTVKDQVVSGASTAAQTAADASKTVAAGASSAAHTAADVTKTVAAGAAHTAVDVTKTVAAGAIVAGAATVSAVRDLFADKGATTDKTDVDHHHPSTMHTTTPATNKTQPIADFPNTQVHNLKDDLISDTHAATGPTYLIPLDVEPIHSTGLDGTTKTGYRAKMAVIHGTPDVPASTTDSRPLTEKVVAPVVGAASAVGNAAVGTAAYL